MRANSLQRQARRQLRKAQVLASKAKRNERRTLEDRKRAIHQAFDGMRDIILTGQK